MPYAILRFAKRKAGGITANYTHNERKKQSYKSNPDIDMERSKQNYHIVQPNSTYRKEVNRMIAAAGCKVRSNSTVMVETIITAIVMLLAIILFITGQTTGGIVFTIIAFLLSPLGIPAIAEWLIIRFGILNEVLKDFITT